jgi:hypothetical protein
MQKKSKIAVVGGGVAGCSVAIYLGKLGLDVTLFEKNSSVISGPPFCHLHSGGNLYREISTQSCITLLKESIDLLRMYPDAIDYRPTVLATPKSDAQNPEDLIPRLEELKKEYSKLIKEDIGNKVLCDSQNYYKIYTENDIEKLKNNEIPKDPKSYDEWMIVVAKNVDFSKIKFPLIMVQEYGLNIFRLGASANFSFDNIDNLTLKLNSVVTNITKKDSSYDIEYNNSNIEQFDFIINCAGFRTGTVDDMLGFKPKRLVEFKSAYVSRWSDCNDIWPEVIFFGMRGTPQGMAQFTPYPDKYFQIHGMTEDITLFNNGLVKSSSQSSQPKLDKEFIDRIDKGWSQEDVVERTTKAINYIKEFIPSFQNVEVGSKPLYGAQQIPGDEISLRTADVCFEDERYARCEIVKASSVLTMSDLIVNRLIDLSILDKSVYKKRDFLYKDKFNSEDITKYAQEICKQRAYPISLAQVNNSKNNCK